MRRGNPAKKNHGAPPADLLVCFPTLKPKQICSSARLSDPTIHGCHLNKLSSTRLGAGTSSPVLWDKDKIVGSDASEPSSPKVTCAGQIKARRTPAAASRKSWQSVMEEIERIHIKKQKSRASWGDALGFLNCLRSIKLDFRCFRAMPECDISSDEDKDEVDNLNDKSSGNKWFMYLQENQDTLIEPVATQNDKETDTPSVDPPPNALQLMRCRSAPAKSWLENRARAIVEQEERNKKTQQQNEEEEEEEEETEEKQRLSDYLVVMEYDTDFYKLSNDIAKETWVVGSINPNNPFPKSRSWKR
ncbi:unnamed protein product [Rhodiola kirilowii]